MITHMVLLKVRRDAHRPDVAQVFADIGELQRKIPGITSYTWGVYTSKEGLNRGYTHGFCMTFLDAPARDAYLTHPEHEKVKGKVVEILEGGIEGALAFDYEAA